MSRRIFYFTLTIRSKCNVIHILDKVHCLRDVNHLFGFTFIIIFPLKREKYVHKLLCDLVINIFVTKIYLEGSP